MLRILALLAILGSSAAAVEPVHFEPWSSALFDRARDEHRYLLLDLGAVWCHWCHVMEATTYRDPAVARLIGDRFVAVRADQDADPDLSRRYEDYGWPATIVFAPDGSEIVKRRGYIPPAAMASLLQAIVDDPSPGPSVQPELPWAPSARTRLGAGERRALERNFVAAFDGAHAGWGTLHKYLDTEAVEYALSDPRFTAMARRTLDAALLLLDPVWGGMYQYSDAVDWRSPHYEKLMSVQAPAIEIYVRAYRRLGARRYLDAAVAIAGYLRQRLRSPGGAFYVSQDADLDAHTLGKSFYALDDAGRRALGEPSVDRHVYPRENGWAIAALATLAAETHDASLLVDATRAAAVIEADRRGDDGVYRHGEARGAGPFLGDTLAMAQAYIALAAAEPSGPWRARALAAAAALDAHFRADAGFFTAPVGRDAHGVFQRPARLVDENVAIVRLARQLSRLDADPRWPAMRDHALRYLVSPSLPRARPFSPGVLLVERSFPR